MIYDNTELKRFSIDCFSSESREVNILEGSDVDRPSFWAIWHVSFGEALHATGLTEEMADLMRMKSVLREWLVSRYELEISRRHEWEKESLSLTVWAIAFEDRLCDIESYIVFYCTAVAASGMSHRKKVMYYSMIISYFDRSPGVPERENFAPEIVFSSPSIW